ncbi:hypothetical protein [Mumia sp. DW29H23]|uniref:hypothetical protein n=1 Tax=Mumia sp. DW29H23 TaxID=3421241 RepID=UPI003D694F55
MRTHAEPGVPRPLAAVAALVVASIIVALVTLAVGLGSSQVAGQRTAAASVVPPPGSPTAALEQMLTALGRSDVRAACGVAAPDGFPIRTPEALSTCETSLRDQLEELDPRLLKAYREVDVRGAFVEGNSATVRPGQIAGAPVAMRKAVFVLVEAGGAWYVVV